MSPVLSDGIVHAGDLFDGLRPEMETEPSRQIEIKKNSVLEEIIKSFENAVYYTNNRSDTYLGFCGSLPKRYSSKDITEFSVLLGNYRFEDYEHGVKSGLFLSALINECKDDSIIVLNQFIVYNFNNRIYLELKNLFSMIF